MQEITPTNGYGIEEPYKMDFVEMYLEGKADIWFQSVKAMKGNICWEQLSEMMIQRFAEKLLRDEVEAFNKLQQISSVLEYQEQFEELKTRMLVRDPRLPESYFISSFISGLKEDIKPIVKMMKPGTLLETFEIAQLQEQALDSTFKRGKGTWKSIGELPQKVIAIILNLLNTLVELLDSIHCQTSTRVGILEAMR